MIITANSEDGRMRDTINNIQEWGEWDIGVNTIITIVIVVLATHPQYGLY